MVKTRLKLLMVSDSAGDEQILHDQLRSAGFEPVISRVDEAGEFVQHLTGGDHDLLVADPVLVGFSGLEAFRLMSKLGRRLPTILLTQEKVEHELRAAMEAGVDDYISKRHLARLGPAIDRLLSMEQQSLAHKRTERALGRLEEQFSRFMKYLPGAAFIKDSEGRLLYVNQYFVQNWARISEADSGNSQPLWPKVLGEAIGETDRYVLETGEAVESIDTLLQDGERVNYLTIKFPIAGSENGVLLGGISINITRRKAAEDQLRELTEQLEREREQLERKNIALSEVLDRVERAKEEVRTQVAGNIEARIMPALKQVRDRADGKLQRQLNLLESALSEVASPFLSNLHHRATKLSPREIEVSRMIRQGLTTKEIAEDLNLSPGTIQKHRETIRKKLGLNGKAENLQNFLKSL